MLGQHYYVLNAPVSAVDGILPGQGQAVTIAGVDVGEISGVRLGANEPVVTMRLDGRYGSRIYSNATVLLRPKTGLEDMVAELDPGSAARRPPPAQRRDAQPPPTRFRRSASTRRSPSSTPTPGPS